MQEKIGKQIIPMENPEILNILKTYIISNDEKQDLILSFHTNPMCLLKTPARLTTQAGFIIEPNKKNMCTSWKCHSDT